MPYHYGQTGSLFWVHVNDGEQRVTLRFLDEYSQRAFIVALDNAEDMINVTDGETSESVQGVPV